MAAVVVAIIVAIVAYELTSSGSSKTSKAQPHQPAVNFSANGAKVYGTLGPENVPLELGAPLAAPNTGLTGKPIDGVQCNVGEQLAYHHHVHVAIFINGQPRSVPIAVGMVPPAQVEKTPQGDFAESASCFYWLHVHAQDGIVHIESPIAKTYELGQVFDIWHQPLSSTQLGPYTGKVTTTVNGAPWTGNPAQIPLNEHTQIVLNLGGPVVAPPLISWSGTGL
ncbi:MAG: hypothetical protein ACRDYY_04120 [Acidimicrobiales bacterium]